MADYKLDQSVKYAKSHEWVRIDGKIAVVGISDAAQDMLSDVVYVELPKVGANVGPRSGGRRVGQGRRRCRRACVRRRCRGERRPVCHARNRQRVAHEAWFFKIEPTDSVDAELANLMTPEEYDKFVEESGN